MADRRASGRACRVVVLASGGGSNLAALLAASADPAYGATVVAVGADRDGIGALDIAAEAGVPTFVERVSDHPERAGWDRSLTERTAAYEPDLVVSAGFLKLVGPAFLARFGDRYINTHNSLLPSFPGMNGPRDALAYGVKVAGATLFFVDEGVDTGPIIAQAAVPVLDDDTEDTLTERIKVAERAQLVEYVGRLAREGWTINERRVTIAVTEVRTPVRRALISVYDKTGLEELARGLAEAGVEIVSTGSTAARIADAGVAVTRVEELTGFPECLDGRVKTLHPAVHAGLLADVRHDSHREQLADLGIDAFTLLVSNLYPFAQTVASGAGPDDVVEQIDIGGPSMVRGAAKNHANVAVVVDPARYGDVLAAVRAGGFTLPERQRLAAEAFVHTATYDVHVASWMSNVLAPAMDVPAAPAAESADDAADAAGTSFPSWIGATWQRASVLRYGENPHQKAALYVSESGAAGIAGAEQLHGKEMSYNNYVDADAAWRCAHDFDQPAVAVIKHANPCGIAVGADIAEAHRKANATDPVSAYGGVIAANGIVTEEAAQQIGKVFTEVVIAPGFEPAAVELLARKKNIRLLRVGAADAEAVESRRISGGLLVQQVDRVDAAGDDPAAWTLAAGAPADDATLADLVFAWRASRSVKSNAILLASGGAAVGVGMGQVNRVDAARLAVERAAERAAGSVAASDAYFPFDDGARVLMEAGVRALVQPGGSVRDEDVVAAADEHGVTMYFTGSRHFFH